ALDVRHLRCVSPSPLPPSLPFSPSPSRSQFLLPPLLSLSSPSPSPSHLTPTPVPFQSRNLEPEPDAPPSKGIDRVTIWRVSADHDIILRKRRNGRGRNHRCSPSRQARASPLARRHCRCGQVG